jgi:hypothetical protein
MSGSDRYRAVVTAGAGRVATPTGTTGTTRFPASTDSNDITGPVILADGGTVLV